MSIRNLGKWWVILLPLLAAASGVVAIDWAHAVATLTGETPPGPDLKVEESDDWVTVTDSDIFSVTVSLDAGDWEGEEVELWVVAGTSEGPFAYIPNVGWGPRIQPSWRGALSSFDAANVWLDMPPLEQGEYWLGFAVDPIINGLIDATWFDLAAISVHPTPGWDMALGGPGDQYGWDIQRTLAGTYLIFGSTQGADWQFDPYLAEIDAEGGVLWTKTVEVPFNDSFEAYDVQQITEGGYIMTGMISKEDEGTGNSDTDVFLMKLDAQGVAVWEKTFDSSFWDRALSVRKTPDGGFILGGDTAFGGGLGFFLIKTDPDGRAVWAKTYTREGASYFSSLALTADG